MLFTLCIVVVVSLSAAQVSSPIPILDTDPGVRYNATSKGAQVRIDVMLEPTCFDSVGAWNELKLVADYYGPGR